jgi:NADH dehydrogenase
MMCPQAPAGTGVGLDGLAGSSGRNGRRLVRCGLRAARARLGSVRTLPIPGLTERPRLKNLADAIHLRNHILRELEAADAELDAPRAERHLPFVFVGAGYAGVEALAELSPRARRAALLPRLRGARQRCARRRRPDDPPEIPTRLGEYARQLTGRGIDIRVGTTPESVDETASCSPTVVASRRIPRLDGGRARPPSTRRVWPPSTSAAGDAG